MTHDDYTSRLATLTDSPADTQAVLEHVSACAICQREHAFVDRQLATGRSSAWEPLARAAAALALLALLIFGLRHHDGDLVPAVKYRIVGNASGVVAYTPGGIVTGTIHVGSRRQR